jgi:predicted GNAT family N-acyltransferase
MKLIIKEVYQISDRELTYMIRERVFIEEQKVPHDIEFEYEDESHPYLALLEGEPVGTARWRKTNEGIKLERFAVLTEYRNRGIATQLLKRILDDLGSEKVFYMHAQTSAALFYEKNGFRPKGDTFVEAGLEHIKMYLYR